MCCVYLLSVYVLSSLVVPRRASSFPLVPTVNRLDVLVVLVVLFLKIIQQLAQPGSAPELVLGVERIRPGLTGGAGVSVILRRRNRIVLVQSAVCPRKTHPIHPESVASVAR